MKKREMIIVGVALLAAGYGILDYAVLSKRSSGTLDAANKVKQTELTSFVEVAQAQLVTFSGTENARVQYQIAKAEAQWTNDPFEALPLAAAAGGGSQTPSGGTGVELHYSGFIKAGKQILAVINKMEYNIGDALLELGYRVVSISPERVVLMTEASSEIIIPLEEN